MSVSHLQTRPYIKAESVGDRALERANESMLRE
jgi:hypothetical protein